MPFFFFFCLFLSLLISAPITQRSSSMAPTTRRTRTRAPPSTPATATSSSGGLAFLSTRPSALQAAVATSAVLTVGAIGFAAWQRRRGTTRVDVQGEGEASAAEAAAASAAGAAVPPASAASAIAPAADNASARRVSMDGMATEHKVEGGVDGEEKQSGMADAAIAAASAAVPSADDATAAPAALPGADENSSAVAASSSAVGTAAGDSVIDIAPDNSLASPTAAAAAASSSSASAVPPPLQPQPQRRRHRSGRASRRVHAPRTCNRCMAEADQGGGSSSNVHSRYFDFKTLLPSSKREGLIQWVVRPFVAVSTTARRMHDRDGSAARSLKHARGDVHFVWWRRCTSRTTGARTMTSALHARQCPVSHLPLLCFSRLRVRRCAVPMSDVPFSATASCPSGHRCDAWRHPG